MPAQQRGLFDDLDAAVPAVSPVRAGSAAQPLTKSQRRFNRLTARLQELAGELASWQRAVDRFRRRAAVELEPLQRELLAEQRAAVLFIDALVASKAKDDKLMTRRRRKLRDLAVVLAAAVLEAGPDDDVEAIFDRHSGVRHSEVRRSELEMAEAMFDVVLGDDLMVGHTATCADELFEQAGERLYAKLEAEAEQPREQTQARRAPRKPPERARECDASQSVRDLFRRLVAALHPDREPDRVERERKTALMQRVNRAYERDDLLELLKVQIEIEQIDSGHLARASEERLDHYCTVLREQQHALEQELAAIQQPFLGALDLAPHVASLQPEALDVLLDHDARNGREVLEDLRGTLEALRDPSRRNATIDGIAIPSAEPDPLDAMLFEAAFAPPPPRRRKGKKARRR